MMSPRPTHPDSPVLDLEQFEGRKRDHIELSLKQDHQASGRSGLDQVRLEHEALPELDLEEVSLATECLGRPLATPFFVAGMTMGHTAAAGLNHRLARACADRGWAMGIGSQRREFESSELAAELAREGRALREAAPGALLLANLGISQLVGGTPESSSERVLRLLDSIEAQGLVIHLNALQEALQPEGTPRFRGGIRAIEGLVARIHRAGPGIPVVVKETGCGISEATARRLGSAGVAAIDVSGLGGTHWGRIEGARATAGSLRSTAAGTFADWGIPTLESVRAASKALSANAGFGYSIWASGGVRNGLDAAKLIATGAHRVGFAQPALRAAMEGDESLLRWMEQMEFELRVALFCTGSASTGALRGRGVHESR
jgi:isopentenyl-diphosphate delta-isomerase